MRGCGGARSRYLALQSQTLTVLKLHQRTGARTGARDTYFGPSKPKNGTIDQGLENPTGRKVAPSDRPSFLAFLSGFPHG